MLSISRTESRFAEVGGPTEKKSSVHIMDRETGEIIATVYVRKTHGRRCELSIDAEYDLYRIVRGELL